MLLGGVGERYHVELWPEGEAVHSRCTCPAYGKYGPHCKHVVAAGLVYRARVRAALRPIEPDEEPPAPSPVAADPVSLPSLAKLESWLGLSSLPDHEFMYRLTPSAGTTGGRHWVMDVRRSDAQAKGPIHVKRFLSAGTRISPPDERVFIELARHEIRFDARIVLSDEDVATLIDLLRHRRVIYRGTPLVFADAPAKPQISLETRSGSALARLELALPDGVTMSLKDVVLIGGRKTYAIAGQTLYPVEPDFPPRLLRKWLLEPSMAFPESQLDRILAFFAAHLPRFRMGLRAEGLEVDDAVEPTFVLTIE